MDEQLVLDSTDKLIIDKIQSDFPINKRPYKIIAQSLNLSEDEVWQRVQKIRQSGYIRRLGANFDSRSLGYATALCAAKVAPEKLAKFVEIVNQHQGVTHNYLRENKLNVWFTYIAPNQDKLEEAISDIKKKSGVEEIYILPTKKLFKIKVKFQLSDPK